MRISAVPAALLLVALTFSVSCATDRPPDAPAVRNSALPSSQVENAADSLVMKVEGWSGVAGSGGSNLDAAIVSEAQFGDGFTHDWGFGFEDPLGSVADMSLTADVLKSTGLTSFEDTGMDYTCSHWTGGAGSPSILKNCQLVLPGASGGEVALKPGIYTMNFYAKDAKNQLIKPYSADTTDAQLQIWLEVENAADSLVMKVEGWSGGAGSGGSNLDAAIVSEAQFGDGFTHDWGFGFEDPLGSVADMSLTADVLKSTGLTSFEDTGMDYTCSHWTGGAGSPSILKNCQLVLPRASGGEVALEPGIYTMRFYAKDAKNQLIKPYSADTTDAQLQIWLEVENAADSLVMKVEGWSGGAGSGGSNLDAAIVPEAQFGDGFTHDWGFGFEDPLGSVADMSLTADVLKSTGLTSNEDTGMDYTCSHWTGGAGWTGVDHPWSAILKNCQLVLPGASGGEVALKPGIYTMRFYAKDAKNQLIKPYSADTTDAQLQIWLEVKERLADRIVEERLADRIVEERLADRIVEERLADRIVEERLAGRIALPSSEVDNAADSLVMKVEGWSGVAGSGGSSLDAAIVPEAQFGDGFTHDWDFGFEDPFGSVADMSLTADVLKWTGLTSFEDTGMDYTCSYWTGGAGSPSILKNCQLVLPGASGGEVALEPGAYTMNFYAKDAKNQLIKPYSADTTDAQLQIWLEVVDAADSLVMKVEGWSGGAGSGGSSLDAAIVSEAQFGDGFTLTHDWDFGFEDPFGSVADMSLTADVLKWTGLTSFEDTGMDYTCSYWTGGAGSPSILKNCQLVLPGASGGEVALEPGAYTMRFYAKDAKNQLIMPYSADTVDAQLQIWLEVVDNAADSLVMKVEGWSGVAGSGGSSLDAAIVPEAQFGDGFTHDWDFGFEDPFGSVADMSLTADVLKWTGLTSFEDTGMDYTCSYWTGGAGSPSILKNCQLVLPGASGGEVALEPGAYTMNFYAKDAKNQLIMPYSADTVDAQLQIWLEVVDAADSLVMKVEGWSGGAGSGGSSLDAAIVSEAQFGDGFTHDWDFGFEDPFGSVADMSLTADVLKWTGLTSFEDTGMDYTCSYWTGGAGSPSILKNCQLVLPGASGGEVALEPGAYMMRFYAKDAKNQLIMPYSADTVDAQLQIWLEVVEV